MTYCRNIFDTVEHGVLKIATTFKMLFYVFNVYTSIICPIYREILITLLNNLQHIQ